MPRCNLHHMGRSATTFADEADAGWRAAASSLTRAPEHASLAASLHRLADVRLAAGGGATGTAYGIQRVREDGPATATVRMPARIGHNPAVSTGESFAAHLRRPRGKGYTPEDALTGAAGGAACGDVVRVSVALERDSPQARIADAGFDAEGCGALIAAGSATVALTRGRPLLEAARIGAGEIAQELGGLSPAKLHAAELACDALHRALGHAAGRAQLQDDRDRTVVAMSGGVDSAVAAILTARQGADPVAVTLELWADPENDAQRSCCSAASVRHARALAHRLGLPHLSIDMREQFRAGVVDPWLAGHAAGRTPYPCALCNGRVRLDGMLDLASRLGSPTLVTGHYARVWGGDGEGGVDERVAPDGRTVGGAPGPLLRVAADRGKDQSYALAALPRASLERMRFPLGGVSKERVREIARGEGLAVARRPDSQDLCFLAGTSKAAFLEKHGGIAERPGAIVGADGRLLGEHRGAYRFTVGQRRGLGLGAAEPLYVLSVDTDANRVVVGSREQMRSDRVAIEQAVLHRDGGCVDSVKVNYRGARRACTLDGTAGEGRHERLTALLADPAERTAAGQLACLYSGELIVGHGTIA